VKLTLIVAVADNGVIGRQNELPWRLPADLKRFKAITMGKPIIMGRKTFESIGKPLPGRTNIVITRQSDLSLPGCVVVASLQAALVAAGDVDEAMIIGGAEIYRQSFAQADCVQLTEVHAVIEGDVRFPALSSRQWREIVREDYPADERHAHAYSFVTLERV
jgi:dihydrofolate reductase